VRPDPDPVQPSTVLALSRTLRAGSAGAAAFAAASLTAAARGALPEGRSGRRDGRFRSNKGMLLIDLNEPHLSRHDQLLNLTHTTVPVRSLRVPSHVPSHPQTAAKVRGVSPIASGFTAETDWLLEEGRFEPSVPL
jgi:hypothetical protein